MNKIVNEIDWRDFLEKSRGEALVVFKHSNSCSVSLGAFEKVVGSSFEERVYLVIVPDDRLVSNMIADELGVVHKSPQVIVVKDGKSLYDESHFEIECSKIEEVLSNN